MLLALRIDRLDQAEVSAPSTNVTLLATSASYQVMTPSASIDVNLPSVDIKKGRIFEFFAITNENERITLKSSNGDVIDRLGFLGVGAETHRSTATLIALQDAPTTAAHWTVLYITTTGQYTPTVTNITGFGGTVTTVPHSAMRLNDTLNVTGSSNSSSAAGSGAYMNFRFTLPMEENTTNTGRGVSGYMKTSTPASSGGWTNPQSATEAAVYIWRSAGTDSANVYYQYQYKPDGTA